MEDNNNKAMEGIERYLKRSGFIVLDRSWQHSDGFCFIAVEKDELVFIICQLSQNNGKGFPATDLNRSSLECLAIAYLADHPSCKNYPIRFDLVNLLILNSDKAFLRHQRDALSDPQRFTKGNEIK